MTEVKSDATRMPLVDFEKDKVPEYLKDQAKYIEKDNIRRAVEFKRKLNFGRYSGFFWTTFVGSIYAYTFYKVKQETFLDDFELNFDDDEDGFF